MQHDVVESADGRIISLSGRITFRDFSGFKSLLGDLDALKSRSVVFDLSMVEFMDSAALGMILLARDKASSMGVSLSLRGVKGQVKRLMQIMKFEQALA